jgi:uncharacterized protein (TIGR03382 family)
VYAVVATGIGSVNLTIDVTAPAVPEPALLGAALVVVALLGRRRRIATKN